MECKTSDCRTRGAPVQKLRLAAFSAVVSVSGQARPPSLSLLYFWPEEAVCGIAVGLRGIRGATKLRN